jgi:hypothetical protein
VSLPHRRERSFKKLASGLTSTGVRLDPGRDGEDAPLLDVAEREVEVVDEQLHVGDVAQRLIARRLGRTVQFAFAFVALCSRKEVWVRGVSESDPRGEVVQVANLAIVLFG